MSGQAGRCDLCDLPLPRSPILETIGGEPSQFCCEGCARVYSLAYETGLLDQVLQSARSRPGVRSAPSSPAAVRPVLFQPTQAAFFDVDGMWCAGCAVAAERVLLHQPGVKDASVSFATERGRVEYDPARANAEDLMKILGPLGYRARVTSTKEEEQKRRFQDRIGLQLMAATAFGMEIMVLYLVQLYPLYAFGLYNSLEARRIQYLVWLMATPVVFYGGLTFLTGAWRSLRARTVGMDTLVAVGVLSAYFYSAYVTLTGNGQTYFDSATMIVDFILVGRYLEAAGGAQARKDLRSLLRLQPEHAWKRTDTGEGWQQVSADTLAAGDTILVKPGERVPADAHIVEGGATLDESLLTGESLPVIKREGDLIYDGTVVQEGALTCRVLHPPGSTRLSQITALVNETLSQKPRIQRLADRASTVLGYVILVLALLTFVGWYLRTRTVAAGMLAAVAVLVVACPCALGLATPLAMAVTMGHAAHNGILVRTPQALETSAALQRMVFDKTGTLTRGQLAVVRVAPAVAAGLGEPDLLQMAAAVEQYSEHPIARAITLSNVRPLLPTAEFFSVRGAGASAVVQIRGRAERISVGSARLVDVNREPALLEDAQHHATRGQTVIWIDQDGKLAGFIALRDQPNPTAREALRTLEKAGVETVMLSGDSALAAEAIARELSIGAFEGGCSPEDKARKIASWQEAGLKVGMVGDGVNDAPALAQANLSITVAGGTDIAGEASDLVLTHSDLKLVPWFLELSRRTRRTIIQNLGWAFAYNLVSIPLAMLGLINPVIASVAMAVSSILVVANSLRLRSV